MTAQVDSWHGLYGESWKGAIVDEAFSHPAKFSRALIRAIYDHAVAEGWLGAGDSVVDPFGGVALGALDAMRLGLHWTGVELEEKFVKLGRQNITLWCDQFHGVIPGWGTATLVQGDSRRLCEVVGEVVGAISSPPFMESLSGRGECPELRPDGSPFRQGRSIDLASYGSTPGQLAAMPEGQFEAAVSSPPYEAGCAHTGGDDLHPEHIEGGEYHGIGYQAAGSTDGNLAHMDACVSSPPYAEQPIAAYDGSMGKVWRDTGKTPRQRTGGKLPSEQYGSSPGQLGTESAATFWSAARTIVEQVHRILVPGGVAIFVCKDFVRDKARVPFTHQWAELCESVGFEWLHEHRCWVVEHNGTQLALIGDDVEMVKERKSFFRRLAERNGSPRIDWESVLCMRRRP